MNVFVTKRLLFPILCFVSVICFATKPLTKPSNNYILIINTYTESLPKSSEIISEVTEFASRKEDLSVYIEHMNMLMMDSHTIFNEYKKQLFNRYTGSAPKMIVFIGTSPMLLRHDIKEIWGDVPVLLCTEQLFIGPDSAYIKKTPVPISERIPISSLTSQFNLTLLQCPIFLKENVELMRKMIPQMDTLLFVIDQTYANQETREELKNLMKKDYPTLNFQTLSAKDYTTDELVDLLTHINPVTTGILFSSWLHKKQYTGNNFLIANSYRIISLLPYPIFTINPSGIDEDGNIIGGCIYNEEEFKTHLLKTLEEINQGKEARDIPFYMPTEGKAIFNYQALISNHLSPNLTPRNTLFYHRPPTFLEKYRYALLILVLCVLIGSLYLLHIYRRAQILEKLNKAQKQKIEFSNRYTELFNNMPIIYMKLRAIKKENHPLHIKFIEVNPQFEKTFSIKAENGKACEDISLPLSPEFLHIIEIVIHEGRNITFPYYYQSGNTFYDIVLAPSLEKNIVDAFWIDSTERHWAQQKLASTNHKLALALDIANIVPWKWDLKKHTILCDVNKPIELSSMANGEVKEEQLSVPDSKYFAKIVHADRERVKKVYQDLVEGKIEKVKEEYRVITPSAKGYHIDWVEAQAAVETRDEEGRPLTLVGSSLVITERKKMELDLISAKDRAEESNRLKSAFLANMSHEIRTPLNAIVGFSGILASTEEEDEKQEYVSIIENNNSLLLQLINDILDLSKIEAGTLEFVYSDFDANQIIKEMEESFRLKLKTDKVTLVAETGLPSCQIHMEKNRLSQILINLLTNACKFTQEGTIRFGYTLEDKMLRFYVTDTGCGIPADKANSVFERFVKLNNFAQGTGLGLPICKTIIEHLEGNIGVESKEGEGSTFWFTIPYTPAEKKEKAAEESLQPILVEKDKLTIMIAEDDDNNYCLLNSILKNDYRLIHAWNGKEAVNMFKEYNPHLILMDLNMPEMDGYMATKEIRKISKKVPIIAVTAFAYASDEQKVMDNGFDGYMSKPINAKQLKAQINSILGKRLILI